MKTITDYEIIIHGIEYSDYFTGCGVAFTEFTGVATGIGNSVNEALNDALEQLAQADWDVDNNNDLEQEVNESDTNDIVSEYAEENHLPDCEKCELPYVYVSVRVK